MTLHNKKVYHNLQPQENHNHGLTQQTCQELILVLTIAIEYHRVTHCVTTRVEE